MLSLKKGGNYHKPNCMTAKINFFGDRRSPDVKPKNLDTQNPNCQASSQIPHSILSFIRTCNFSLDFWTGCVLTADTSQLIPISLQVDLVSQVHQNI